MVQKVEMGMFSYKKVRKHVSQMNQFEKMSIRKKFNKVKNWTIINHVNDRILEKGYTITTEDILDIIKNGNILEYAQKYYTENKNITEILVLSGVRDFGDHKDRLHLVFDITAEKIITLWINDYDDVHETLNMGIYSKGLKVGENYWQELV